MKESLDKLKSYFETGDRPTQQEFRNVMESYHHIDAGLLVTGIVTDSTGNVVVNYSDGTNYTILKTDYKKSIKRSAGDVELVNDLETPNKDTFYGANDSQEKGFHKLIEVLDFHSYVNNRAMRESFGRKRVPHTTYFEKEFNFLRSGKYAIVLSTKISTINPYYYFEGRLHFNNVLQDVYQEKFGDRRTSKSERYSRALMGVVDAKKGNNKVKFDFRGQSTRSRATVHNAKLLIYRISE